MMHSWHMHEAKARLSALVRRAECEGPQAITVHDRLAAVVLSRADYDKLARTNESLVSFMRRSPLADEEDMEFSREKSLTREVLL